jgi:sirohydrochlorin cobaltochelatase
VPTVLERTQASSVFILPLFLSEGYFTEEAIPVALGLKSAGQSPFPRIQQRGLHTIHYGRPLGDHPRLTDVILARAADVVARHPFPRAPKPRETALLVAGHGTGKSDTSRQNLDRQVEAIRALGLYAEVHAIFLEESPRLVECYRLGQARNFVIVPFFISDGLHTMEDFPVCLGSPKELVQSRLTSGQATWRNPTEKHGKLVWLARCIGSEPLVADLILERVKESRTPLAYCLPSASPV